MLGDRVSGRVVHGSLRPYLTREEESEFADFLQKYQRLDSNPVH